MAAHASTLRGGFLPHGTTAFFRRRLREFFGVVLVFGALAVLATLVSYRPSDPSLNTATIGPVRNFLGLPGAYAADLLLQTFGAAAALLALVPAAWGWRLILHRPLPSAWPRLLLLLPGMLLAAMSVMALPLPPRWPIPAGLGGAAGRVVYETVHRFAGEWGAMAGLPVLSLAAAAVSVPFLMIAVGFRPRDLLGPARLVLALARLAAAGARLVGRLLLPARRQAPEIDDDEDEAPRRRRKRVAIDPAAEDADDEPRPRRAPGLFFGLFARRSERVEPSLFDGRNFDAGTGPIEPRLDDGEFDDDRPTPRKAERLIAPKAARPAPGRRAEAQRQRRLDLGDDSGFRLPALDLLSAPPAPSRGPTISEEALQQNARLLETVLKDFGINGQIVKVRPGPVVTMYELEPAPGIKTSRVIGLADDIARSMSAVSVRAAVVPGQSTIGVELPNAKRDIVYLRELLASDAYERNGGKLPLVLGKDIGGAPVIVDLARMPHLLVAGTTGSGKSVAVNAMILSLLYRLPPDQCRVIMIDPKMLELSVYDGIPHLLSPVVTEPRKAVVALKWTVREMENRYRNMAKLGVRNIEGYNARLAEARAKGEVLLRKVQTGFDPDTGKPILEDQPLDTTALPYIVVVVDEMADLMLVAGKDIEAAIQRLAQMARAAGIHIVMATQRPSVDVVTGTIKANFPTRISFHVTSKIDSRTILGEQGGEQLLGQGDMLYMSTGGRIARVHGPFVRDDEVEQVVAFLKNQGEPTYLEAVTEEEDEIPAGAMPGGNGEPGDDLYDQAVALVLRERKASTSFVQRHLQIGYNRAARLIERMEAEGVVSGANHVGKRDVLGRGGDDDV
ncbi:MAG: DNA translocase FtsK 4TM domain-containing protein [Alphaproteobacteria bacterium]|nr:DNA translocase FtsK 4TM domain-containing protein [Alphaproteobacteria bacterium]